MKYRARRAHVCCLCGKTIMPGEMIQNTSLANYGQGVAHEVCKRKEARRRVAANRN